jgi:hypothetical protein
MKVRITEQVATVTEVSYDVDVPEHVFHESQGESVEDYRDEWEEVHREVIRKHAEIVNVEEM